MTDLGDLVERLADELERSGIAHAFGGALALSYWAPPRATADIDLNLFVPEADLDQSFDALEAASFQVDRAEASRWAAERGDFRAWSGNVRLDVFLPFSPFHDEVRQRCVSKPAPSGRTIQVLSAEDLILFKVLFDRPKDWIDVQQMVHQQGGRIDVDYLGRWLRDLLPENDGRIERLQALVSSAS